MNKTDLYNLIKRDSLSESSINMYLNNLIKIRKDYKEDFLSDKLLDKILNDDSIKLSTKKNKVVSILVFLKSYRKNLTENDELEHIERLIKSYSDTTDSLASKIDRELIKMEKNEKESDNWYTLDELNLKLLKMEKELKKLDINSYDYLKNFMKYLLLKIHLTYPMRNDLSDALLLSMSEFKKTKDISKEFNYIVMGSSEAFIILNKFKTVKSKGTQTLKINDKDIMKNLRKYVKALNTYKTENSIDNKYFIIHKKGNKFSRNEYTKLFNEIFNEDSKKVSTTMIRKIICSNVWNIKEIKNLSENMQHSMHQALKNYVKLC